MFGVSFSLLERKPVERKLAPLSVQMKVLGAILETHLGRSLPFFRFYPG